MVDDQDLPRLEDQTTTKEAVSAKLLAGGNELLASEIDPGADEVAELLASQGLDELERQAVDGDGPAARALAARMEAIASRAQLHPDASLVARLGERAGGGPERATWDRAVGSVARYQARWPSEVVEGGTLETWALGARPEAPGAALDAYDQASEHLVLAEVQHLAARPTAALADERHQLLRALGPNVDDAGQRIRLEGDEALALRRLEEATSVLDDAEDALERAGRPRRLRRGSGQALEQARRAVAGARQHVGVATRSVEEVRERLSAFASSAEARQPARQRLSSIDAALDHRVEGALRRVQPYLRKTLGERPSEPSERAAWEHAARLIERHRHHQGLCPDDGALGDVGLAASVGVPPSDQVARQHWLRLQEAIGQSMGPPEQGITR
jgi:hypothetical protein